MIKWKLVILLTLLTFNAEAQKKNLETEVYYIKYSAEDSIRLEGKNQEDALTVGVLDYRLGNRVDTFSIGATNFGNNSIYSIKVCVFSGLNNNLIKIIPIPVLDVNKTISFAVPVERDSIYSIVYSDFSNPTKHFTYVPKQKIFSLKYDGFVIDDSTPVSRLEEKPFKVDGILDKGETGRFRFNFSNIGRSNVGQFKAQLRSYKGEIEAKPIKTTFNTMDSIRGNGTLIYDISSPLYAKNISMLLTIKFEDSVIYEQPIIIEFGKNYNDKAILSNVGLTIQDDSISINSKQNTVLVTYSIPKIEWDRTVSAEISVYNKTDSTKVMSMSSVIKNNRDVIRFGLPADGIFRAKVEFRSKSALTSNRYVFFKYTPSLMNGVFNLENQKLGLRFLAIKRFGYYFEFNSTLSRLKSNSYVYDSESRVLKNFDSYSNYYIAKPEVTAITRDAGFGLAYRINKSIFVTAGVSYFHYRLKQEIAEYSYSMPTISKNIDVLLVSESYTKLIQRMSINYLFNKKLSFGMELVNYNRNSTSPRATIIVGCKF